jgi:hypothetical protein
LVSTRVTAGDARDFEDVRICDPIRGMALDEQRRPCGVVEAAIERAVIVTRSSVTDRNS